MEKQIENLILKAKPDLSHMSCKTYANCCNKVLEFIKSTDMHDLTKSKEIIKVLNEKYEKPNTIKTKIASIIVCLKCIQDKKNKKVINTALNEYSNQIEILNGNVKSDLSDKTKNTRQKEGWLSSEDVEKLNNILENNVPKAIKTPRDLVKLRDAVLFKIYQDIPSRSEMAEAKIIYKPTAKLLKDLNDEYNYIILDKTKKTAVYQINQSKTSKTTGQRNVDISKELYPLLDTYKKAVDNFNDGHWFLLNDSATAPLTRNRLGVIYSNIGKPINKKLGISINRHIAISNELPIDKVEKLAEKMGTSVNQALNVYAKK
jgi:integrase